MYVKSIFADINAVIKKVELEAVNKGEIYPVTIVMDRYIAAPIQMGGGWLSTSNLVMYLKKLAATIQPKRYSGVNMTI